jgi:hypothetical protein
VLTDDFRAHALSLERGEGRGEATGNDVHEDRRRRKLRNGLAEELLGLHALDKADVRARRRRELEAVDGLVHAVHLRRVRAADDHKVGAARDLVARDDGGADAGDELLAGHDLFAEEVAAALGLDLVLDVARSDAGAVVLEDGARNRGRATEASVGVSDDGRDRVKRCDHGASLKAAMSAKGRRWLNDDYLPGRSR